MKSVQALAAEGLNTSFLQLFGVGPKWTITCGSCRATFRKRLPFVDHPGIICPQCGVVNVVNITWEFTEDC